MQIPLYLKVGYLRARAPALLPFLLPIGAALLVAAPAAPAVSYAVSLRIYDAKDL
uniref:hypothetical protein n=1 Tax=Nonomuraea pusilla TaxID=46177 RepID=UPI000AEF61B2|nr:hypothetical protein [Nonomuraea pusilla]